MPRPDAKIFLSNGNLGGQALNQFGVAGVVIASPAAPAAGYAVPFILKSKKQAETAFAAPTNALVLDAITKGFFAEAPEGSTLYVICVAQATSLTQMSVAGIAGALLNFANGAIRILAAIKFPAGSYVPVIANGFDSDVHDAVTAMQTLADTWLTNRKPFRALIQGYEFSTVGAAKDYANDTKRNVAVVVGSISDSTALATLMALGRASKEEPQRNIGRVKSKSLAIAANAVVKLGAAVLENIDSVDLDTLYDKRYISFERNQTAPGYIFTDDNMLTALSDDYNSLRHGRVIDNAVRIAYSAYYEELKEDVDVDENGRLSPVVEKALETKIESAIDAQMRSQLSKKIDGSSAVECLVNPSPTQHATLYQLNNISNPNFNILATNKVYVFVKLRPKGCLKYIDIFLGLGV
jgi:hypothetical protein